MKLYDYFMSRQFSDQYPNTMSHCWFSLANIGEIHYHKENKTNGGKQIEFSAESNQFEKKIKSGNK